MSLPVPPYGSGPGVQAQELEDQNLKTELYHKIINTYIGANKSDILSTHTTLLDLRSTFINGAHLDKYNEYFPHPKLLAWMVAREADLQPHSPVVSRGLAFLLEKGSLHDGRLSELLPRLQKATTTECIYKVLLSLTTEHCSSETVKRIGKISSMYTQDWTTCRDTACLTDSERLHISIFSNMTSAPKASFPRKQFDLPRALEVSEAGTAILSKGNMTADRVTTSTKKITTGCLYRQDLPPLRIARIVPTSPSLRPDLEKEIKIQQMLYNLEPKGVGIWPILGVNEYVNAKGDVKFEFIMPFGEVLDAKKAQTLTLSQLVEMIRQLSVGVCKLHESGLLHADIKTKNTLIMIYADGTVKAGFIDFGFTFEVAKVVNPKDLPGAFEKQFYGSYYPTAPEVLGRKAFTGNWFAAEMSAFGHLLYQLVLQEVIPWDDIITPYVKSIGTRITCMTQEHVQKVMDSINLEIEIPCSFQESFSFVEGPKRTREQQLKDFVFSHLRLSPLDRFDCRQSLEAITRIQQQIIVL